MALCEDPDILNVLYIFKTGINLVTISAIVILVIMIILDVIKVIASADADTKKITNSISKRIIATVIIFLIPSILNIVIQLTGQTLDYGSCIDNANREYISVAYANKAEEYVRIAQQSLNEDNLYRAKKYVKKIKDEYLKEELNAEIKTMEKYIIDSQTKKLTPPSISSIKGSVNSDVSYEGYMSTKSCPSKTEKSNTQPSPDCALRYNNVNLDNFIYPQKNGKSLGAWPKDYEKMTHLTITKKYQSNKLIFPVTPTNNKYSRVYDHGGIDIKAPIGTPVYAPGSGTLRYSEWGHTDYKQGNETAYTVTIFLDNPIEYEGKKYDTVFLTHMSGIADYCKDGKCNKHVNQGELIGFVGNAGGVPHLHMSYYIRALGYEKSNIPTKGLESIYNLNCNGCSNEIKAGG